MKKLILVRHAKSSWKHNVIDHERPLNERGKTDAALVSQHFLSYKLHPDLVLSSDAYRAKHTAEIFISNLKIDPEKFVLNHELYDFSGAQLTSVIKSTTKSVNNLMLFGHNHAITAFVNTYGDQPIENVSTSGVVVFNFDIMDWKDLKSGHTINTIFPKDLK
ncbi:histidine phosphatase family protein [Algibacter miyuki]|uniref:Histidine phosphatase family protein n=1 Tax=Algibacter miyuki TaxID=1306933 RepID=A0ABV5GXR8_9FLAO|nr:histidine phosphatase family protein [Algibacter miyuki]MDN3667478.1 histidine phosphatase family protein [Algibacter miyuki]